MSLLTLSWGPSACLPSSSDLAEQPGTVWSELSSLTERPSVSPGPSGSACLPGELQKTQEGNGACFRSGPEVTLGSTCVCGPTSYQ